MTLVSRERGSADARPATTAALVGALVIGLLAGPARGEETSRIGSELLLGFEAELRLAGLRAGQYANVEWVGQGVEGAGSARLTFSVPEGARAFAAVVAENEALRVRNFAPFEAMSLWVMNPGPEEAEFSLCLRDENSNRGFPVPSTISVPPGKWQRFVVRLALHGLDSQRTPAGLPGRRPPTSPKCRLRSSPTESWPPSAAPFFGWSRPLGRNTVS